jgi:hypothetical protein
LRYDREEFRHLEGNNFAIGFQIRFGSDVEIVAIRSCASRREMIYLVKIVDAIVAAGNIFEAQCRYKFLHHSTLVPNGIDWCEMDNWRNNC